MKEALAALGEGDEEDADMQSQDKTEDNQMIDTSA